MRRLSAVTRFSKVFIAWGLATLKQGYTDWRHFPGFFLDGKYYLGPELMTAIGWLEGQQFYYDELDPTGEPVFPTNICSR